MHLCSNKDDIQVVQVGIDKIIFYGRYTITIVVLKIQIPFLFLLDLCLIQSTFLKKKFPASFISIFQDAKLHSTVACVRVTGCSKTIVFQ